MVGEIRDHETAQVAIHTALTGHLVLSTLHTNSAIDAIPRLIDMGVDQHLIASTLSLVIAQRLVRIICPSCDGMGCSVCSESGFKGRSVIAEIYEPDDKMRELIASRNTSVTYHNHARSQGFATMLDDGMEKASWGVTTREEIIAALQS
jgi:type II secretory ATPase GspE/PulE/Tfp pilus assembly ATPase PilB-like protein